MTQDPKSGAGRGGAKETIRVLWRAERRKYGSLECPFTAACRSVLSILSHLNAALAMTKRLWKNIHFVKVVVLCGVNQMIINFSKVHPFRQISVILFILFFKSSRLSVDFYFDQVLNPPESQLIGSNQSCDLFRLDQINSIIWLLRATDV